MTQWTTTDIPAQTGRTDVITEANTGLGYETAAALAAKGAHVVLAVRNLDKGKDAATLITQRIPGASVALQELDLTSLESIHNAADHLRSRHDHIDLLVNNAGVMMTPEATTRDGFELQFGTNHLGQPRPLRVYRTAARSTAGHPRLEGGDGQQRRPSHRRRNPIRRSAVGAKLRPGSGVLPVQARQLVVHLRTPAAIPRQQHDRRRRP